MTESRFDDLDLREEPPSATRAETDNTGASPGPPGTDASIACTPRCCV